jgi:acetyl-CoA carboxylase biotin carboxyl carrier protein
LPEAKATKMSESESFNEQSEVQVDVEARESNQPNRRRRQRSRQIDPSVNMDELRDLIDLIQENDFAEFEIAREGFRLHVRRGAAASEVGRGSGSSTASERAEQSAAGAQPATGSTPSHPGAQAKSAAAEDQDLHMIPSPIVGTFYRSPSPNADPFVKIGSNVEAETIVCIIEAMKLMNEIQAETEGEVVKIYVENGQPVEYGQPLFGIKR